MSITLESVYKDYKNGDEITEVLKDINFTVKEGEMVAIIGPSGSGKSTLMNIIGCLDRPTKGSYLLAGQDTAKLPDKKLAAIRNKHIGFVFQSFNLLPEYTALENVELAMLYGDASPKIARTKSLEALEMLGLKERLKHKPSQLSGGQKQRVAIARAIVNSPSIILADEPTGNLDSRTGCEVMESFRDLNKSGRTIIIVTHDLDIAQQAERTIRLKDGMMEETK
ncbi:MAG: ABC transporter ATP-binding protein [Thermincola sp.]|nr:ABC transporter ATP-binding protein [Thermincola sp.]MDT3703866.1 ABC transporter ATP-binding protein [Thermincola sp.]